LYPRKQLEEVGDRKQTTQKHHRKEKQNKTKQNKRTRSTLTEYTETQASDNLSQEIGPRSGSCRNSIHRQPCCSVSHVIQLVPCREAVTASFSFSYALLLSLACWLFSM
jgi:hypothetical protein